jgi:outer membrane protein W
MKKLVLVIVAVIAFWTVNGYCAPMLSKGTMELDIEGSFDDKGAAGSQLWIGIGFGYFVADNLELEIAGAYINNDYQTGYHPAVGVQYNFNLGSKFIPFIGANLGWGIWHNKNAKDVNGFVYGIEGGVKYYLADNVALSFSIDADWSNEDLWAEKDGKMSNNDLSCHLGLRYYF